MTFGITWPTNTKEITDTMRDTIGRTITVYVNVSGIPCSTCSLDPVTNLATDPFCAECDGEYWTATLSAWSVIAHVKWRATNQAQWVSGGVIDEGDCKVTITYSDTALSNIINSNYFLVDTRDMYMRNFSLKGVPSINRIAITLLEDPDDV